MGDHTSGSKQPVLGLLLRHCFIVLPTQSLEHQASGYIHLREASGKSVLIKRRTFCSLSASIHSVLLAHDSLLSSRSQAKGPPLFSSHLRTHHFNLRLSFLSVHRPTANPAALRLALTLEEEVEEGG